MNLIGSRIKLVRTELGMTQDALAKAANLHQPNIAAIERGNLKNTFGLAEVARVLGVYESWLKTGKGAKYINPISEKILKLMPDLDEESQAQILTLATLLSIKRKK